MEYLDQVFERTVYPQDFSVEHTVSYDDQSKTAVIDVSLLEQSSVPDVIGYKFVRQTRQADPIRMKPKEHDDLYESAIQQTVLRTIHEVFESVYTTAVEAVVVNGWVTYLDKSTGHDNTSCIISVTATRQEFEVFNLARIVPADCVKKLKGIVAGPLSQIGPVQPLLQLNREDRRFIESQDVLADINSQTNLAEIDWETFEHLVRELFGHMFSTHGAEVKVTQASKDGGVDAVVFDPDPIRGGKFVIQAKRYNNVVPVSAVRDLYGTMISEGASKGILVTTAYYGRDSRSFAKDKPLSLIDGSNLVYLLEQHGYKVRIDLKR